MAQLRSEIDKRYRWDLQSVYKSEKKFQEDFERLKSLIEKLERFQGDLDDSNYLLEFLELYSEAGKLMQKLSRYASMKSDEDTRDQDSQARKAKIQALGSEMSKRLDFASIEIQKIEGFEKLFEEETGLEEYRHHLEDIRRSKEHTRSLEVEQVLSSLSDVLDAPDEAYRMLSNADIEFPEVEKDGEDVQITQSNFTNLLQEPDRELRREVYEKFYGTIAGYENTVGSTVSKNVRRNVKMAQIKNFETAREASLFNNDIPVKVYDNLVETVKENADVVRRHVELKKKALGVEEIQMHDIYMPVTKEESPGVEYEEAREHALEAVAPLGEKYQDKMRDAFEERWIDVYETKGKKSGAYSGGAYNTKKFILMNYQDDVSSMYTLAHELGHSMHSHLSSKNQNYLNSSYPIFAAEVASTVNEALLTRHLLENGSEKMRRHALNHSLENFRSTLFRQTMFADFEQQIHELIESGEALNAKKATEIYSELKHHFYANADVDEHIEKEWMRIPHFYYNFYVFQYATGISAANALVDQILNEGPESYLEFLKSGGSDYPIKLLRETGVNMDSAQPVESAIERYEKRLRQAEEEL